jgi:hypothetical protein
MIILRADNRTLLKDAKYSYILDNYASGVSRIVVANTDGFSANDYIIIGNVGSDNTELVQVSTVTQATGTLALISATRFAHSESTRVTVLGYDKVRFFWTPLNTVPNPSASPVTVTTVVQDSDITTTKVEVTTNPNTTTYSKSTDPSLSQTIDTTPPIISNTDTPLALANLAVDEFYTTYTDSAHSTGYGWFAFYNSTSLTYSSFSNAIPYAGFNSNTVKDIFARFDSSLNSKELRLISLDDKYSWLNEAYSRATKALNLGNWEYNTSGPLTLTINANQSEYLLPSDFSNLLYINDSDEYKINKYDPTFQKPIDSTITEYEIRGRVLVFRPTPTTATTVTLEYVKNAKRLTKMDDVIDLPDDGHYYLIDFMLTRAYKKFDNLSKAQDASNTFSDNVKEMKLVSHKRDNGLDEWTINDEQLA